MDSSGGFGQPFPVVGISGSLSATTYSLPVYSFNAGTGAKTLAGVVHAGYRADSEVGCTDSCKFTNTAVRWSRLVGAGS